MDIRDALHALAETVPPAGGEMPQTTRARVRRRRAAVASVASLLAVALAFGGWMGARALTGSERVVPPAGEDGSLGVTDLGGAGEIPPFASTDSSVWTAVSPTVYRLDPKGDKVAEFTFGNDPTVPGAHPPYAIIKGIAATSDDHVWVGYTVISLTDGKDPCGRTPFLAGSARRCGRVALLRDGKVASTVVVDEPVTAVVANGDGAWVSGVTTLYRVERDAPATPVGVKEITRIETMRRDAAGLWVLAEGQESPIDFVTVLVGLDASDGREIKRVGFPGSSLAVGGGGAWGSSIEREGDRTVSIVFRFDGRTLEPGKPVAVATSFIPAGPEPGFSALGPLVLSEENLWAASSDGFVYRIDAGSQRVEGSVRIPSYPFALLERDGVLWSAHPEGKIVRTSVRPPITRFARAQDAPDYVEAQPGGTNLRKNGFSLVELLGDDRTIVVHWLGGACERLDHVETSYERTRVVLSVVIAENEPSDGSVCPGIGIPRRTVATLREPLGDRSIVNDERRSG